MQQRHKTSNGKLWCVWLKPYEITVDGEKETVKGDMVVGAYYQERKKDPEYMAKQRAYRKTYIQRLRAENPEKYAQILERHRKWYREKYKKKV